MSRSYCKDRKGIQKRIDDFCRSIKDSSDWTTQIKGNSPDYFETISRNDRSEVTIRKVDEARRPYNMLVDKFKDLRLLFRCPFRAMLNDEDLNDFIDQEQADVKNNRALYSCL